MQQSQPSHPSQPSVSPSAESRQSIVNAVGSQLNLCFTCGSCAAECPVNAATGKLDPRAMVRRAAFGQLDQMLHRREIWYCLQCNRCSAVCPMNVTPGELIKFLRQRAAHEGVIAADKGEALAALRAQLQRVRHQVATRSGGTGDGLDAGLRETIKRFDADLPTSQPASEPLKLLGGRTNLTDPEPAPGEKKPAPAKKKKVAEPLPLRAESGSYARLATNLSACFTCYECRDACPICLEPEVYDPLRFFRAAALDVDALLADPAIWLCIGCQSCTAACTQGVQGHMVMLKLQQLAKDRATVSPEFSARFKRASDETYAAWIARVDALLD